jgi:hypothetical protein
MGVTRFLEDASVIRELVENDIGIFNRDTIETRLSTARDRTAPAIGITEILSAAITVGVEPDVVEKLRDLEGVADPGSHNGLVVAAVEIVERTVEMPLSRVLRDDVAERVERAQLETDAVSRTVRPPFRDRPAARISR